MLDTSFLTVMLILFGWSIRKAMELGLFVDIDKIITKFVAQH